MTSIASAPAKVILFGEHFVVHDVKAILCSIDKRVKVTTIPIDEKKILIKSNMGQAQLDLNSKQEIKSSFRPFAFIAKNMIEKHNHEGGLEITIDSDIPSGVGLGSSSACCVAAAGSVSGLFEKLPKEEILKIAIQAEQTVFKNASGADNTVCTYGGIIEYDKKNGFNKLNIEPDFHLIVANSMQTHSTSKIVSKVGEFKEKNSDTFLSLCKKESQLINNVKDALTSNDLVSLGKYMSENQAYLEEIGVSNDKLRSMIDIANKTSYGSKLTGAGGGGCIISITDEQNLDETIKNLQDNNYDCFSTKIDSKGLDTF